MRSEEDNRKRSEHHAVWQDRDARGRFCSAKRKPAAPSSAKRKAAAPSSAKRKAAAPSAADTAPEASAIPSAADTAPEASARRDRSASERALRTFRRREIRSGSGSGSGVAAKKKSRSRSSRRIPRDAAGPSFVITCSSEESSGEESAPEKVNFCDALSTLLIY
jgi:hypothetical protein